MAYYISLFDRFKKPVSKFDFFFIIEQIVDIVRKVKLNSMSIDKIQWDLNNIFINETTREIQFIYLPLENVKENIDILKFIEEIIYSVKPVKGENSEYISRFVYFLKDMKKFNGEEIENFIYQEEKSVIDTIKGKYENINNLNKEIFYNEETGILEEEGTSLLNDNDDLLNDFEGTALLEEANDSFPYLFRISTGEEIYIDKPVFRIGKEMSNSDYCITDNNAISRRHGEIINREQRIYLVDLNSMNKTYINDKEIVPQEEIEIFDGDRITFANEKFIFYV